MLQRNETKAPTTRYQELCLRQRMPRQFWEFLVSKPTFLPFSISRSIEGQKKPKLLFESQPDLQEKYWESLIQLIYHWQPNSQSSPAEFMALFCCENIRTAQFLAFTCMHYMLIKQFKPDTRSYKAETLRTYELWKALNQDEQDTPSVIVVPQLQIELPNNQSSVVSEMITASYKLFISTIMTPQKFFNQYGYIPSYIFYLDTVSLCKVSDFLKQTGV